MPRFLNTKGRRTLGIGLCDRCRRKFPLDDLRRDGNAPGLMVCAADYDELDPYKLGPPAQDNITLRFVRPDVSIAYAAEAILDANGNQTSGGGGIVIPDAPVVPVVPAITSPQWNPADANAAAVITNGNQSLGASSGTGTARTTQGLSAGQHYFEITCTSRFFAGLANVSELVSSFPGATVNSIGYFNLLGQIKVNNVVQATGATAGTGDILAFYVDFGMNALWLYKNNVQTGTTGTPGVSGGLSLPAGPLYIMAGQQGVGPTITLHAVNTYTPLTGFTAFVL